MTQDIENATKAAQSAAFLCHDLRNLAITNNLILSDAVMAEISIVATLHNRLERIISNLKGTQP